MLTLDWFTGKQRRKSGRRRAVDRIVERCLHEASQVRDLPPYRWPLARRLGPRETTLPSSMFHVSELVGGEVQTRQTMVTCTGATVAAWSVLPVVACDVATNTITLQLAYGRPGVQLSGVPRDQVDVVPGKVQNG